MYFIYKGMFSNLFLFEEMSLWFYLHKNVFYFFEKERFLQLYLQKYSNINFFLYKKMPLTILFRKMILQIFFLNSILFVKKGFKIQFH